MYMLVSELSKELDYDMAGPDREVSGVAQIGEAQKGDIVFANRKGDVIKTDALVVITKPIILDTEKTLLLTYDPLWTAMSKVISQLVKAGVVIDYGVSVKYHSSGRGYYLGDGCVISEDALIQPGVMIGNNVTISEGCVIEPNVVIGSGTSLGRNVMIDSNSKIGASSFFHIDGEKNDLIHFQGCGRTIIGDGTHIGSNVIIERGTLSDTVIGKNTMIGNLIDIGHDVRIGNNCKIVSQTGIAGGVKIGNNVTIFGQSGVINDVVIGNDVVVKARTVVTKNVADNGVVYGPFGRNFYDELKLIARMRNYFDKERV